MTKPTREPRPSAPLRRFLDGYLHQDYRLEYPNAEEAARAFVAEAGGWHALLAARALSRFLAWAETVEESAWRLAWAYQGGAWHPTSLSALSRVAESLRPPTEESGKHSAPD